MATTAAAAAGTLTTHQPSPDGDALAAPSGAGARSSELGSGELVLDDGSVLV